VSGVGQVVIVCADVPRAKAFYRDALGIPFLFDAPPGMSFLQAGSVRLMLAVADGEVRANSILYFTTADIEGSVRALEAAGAKIEQAAHLIAKLPGHDLWMAFFRDSEGNLMGLMQEKPSS
jgi:predicted enzyme related to lactoylglutathione lyase